MADIKKQDFDITKPENWGRPLYWCPELHAEAIEQMIRADEIQIAMDMINATPAWYRENPHPRFKEILKTLYKQSYDQMEYTHDDEEAGHEKEFGEAQWRTSYCYPRNEVIEQLLKDVGGRPWIADLGASHGNLPLGISKAGFEFDYLGLCLNHRIEQKLRSWMDGSWKERPSEGQKTILVCTEVLEHCYDTSSIVHSAWKLGIDFDHIVLSIPLGCLFGGLPDWSTRRLGHVRGWTKKEFVEFAQKHWPGYSWQLHVHHSMVLKGDKVG